MEDIFLQLADSLSEQLWNGPVQSVHSAPMRFDEQGYSGAKLLRLHCTFSDGKSNSYICKYADLSERIVMRILTEQKRGHSPFAYSDLQDTSQTAWFIMQDIRTCEKIPCR